MAGRWLPRLPDSLEQLDGFLLTNDAVEAARGTLVIGTT